MLSLYGEKAKKFGGEMAESCGRHVPEAPRGPPMDHAGRSRHQKTEGTIRFKPPGAGRSRHQKTEGTIRFKPPGAGPGCGYTRVAPSDRPEPKTLVKMDGKGGRLRVHQLAAGGSWCGTCGEWKRSTEAPDIPGTWFGPVFLSRLLAPYALPATNHYVSR